MFELRSSKTKNNLNDDDFNELAKHSQGYAMTHICRYSGSDITAVVKEALMLPVRQCQKAKHFKRTPSGGYIPCAPSDPHAEKMTLMDIKDPSLARVPDVSKVGLKLKLGTLLLSSEQGEDLSWRGGFGPPGEVDRRIWTGWLRMSNIRYN